MASRFAVVANKEISQIIKQAVAEILKKVTKFGLAAVLKGKALSLWLEFIDETGEKVFCFQMQNKSCVSLFSWHK